MAERREGVARRHDGLGEAAERGRRALASLTGKEVLSMSGAAREGEGWRLSYEVVELERIPVTTSVLASYDLLLDGDGTVREFERTRRYFRNQADEDYA